MLKTVKPIGLMATKPFRVEGEVEIFQVDKPWVYVRVPRKYTNQTRHLAERGLVAITATLGNSSWNTSLMPMGDGSQFIPLPAKLRKAEDLHIGDRAALSFTLRRR